MQIDFDLDGVKKKEFVDLLVLIINFINEHEKRKSYLSKRKAIAIGNDIAAKQIKIVSSVWEDFLFVANHSYLKNL